VCSHRAALLVLSEGNMYSAQSLAMRTLQRMLGRGRLERIQQRHYGRKLVVRTPAGLESREETNQGTLLTRQTDMAWLIEECEQLGLRLKARVPGLLHTLLCWQPDRKNGNAPSPAWPRAWASGAPRGCSRWTPRRCGVAVWSACDTGSCSARWRRSSRG
jgi:hypothetical protein